MNKYLTKLQLPIFALAVILAIYGFLAIKDLSGKTSELKKENQNLQNNFNTQLSNLTSKINANTTQLAGYENNINALKNKTTMPQILASTTEPAILTKVITKTETREVEKNQAVLVIENVGSFKIDIENGDTAFNVLKKAASQNGFNITYDEYSFGVFVTGIGGIKPTANQYWAFYYNGAFSNVGASAQEIKKGDTIFWQLASW